ncbi:hypothetical protein TRV_03946 [Trichophyton verrucosum HKI 0517]|uniref:Uncharacterized protein n=1 Tax=Trichophyton verrucosum (strain HKI 0517) TaxID=663202 RepID=D4DA02_TRIVH|nr:uncharacterized protein TRV_03946 [Trichophyton verrucosum HKI 0517]EFE41298.1 hypothetical protein TRV_03946 [Trichophyton verrucosum HKI 0517]
MYEELSVDATPGPSRVRRMDELVSTAKDEDVAVDGDGPFFLSFFLRFNAGWSLAVDPRRDEAEGRREKAKAEMEMEMSIFVCLERFYADWGFFFLQVGKGLLVAARVPVVDGAFSQADSQIDRQTER